jgi:hypothetical protein
MPSSTATISPASGSNMVQLLSKTRAAAGVSSYGNKEDGAESKIDEIKHARYRLGSSDRMASIYVKNPFELMGPSIRAALRSVRKGNGY